MAYPVGVSRLPGRTFGKTQVMSNEQAGRQLRMAFIMLELEHDVVLTPNEGDRSRPDQDIVWYEFLAGGPLAARRYTSTHDPETHGNACDIGGPDGDVITDHAIALLDSEVGGVIGRRYGVVLTGKHFARYERWHFNVYPNQAQVWVTDEMIAAALILLEQKRNPTSPEEDDMKPRFVIAKGAGDPIDGRVGFQWLPTKAIDTTTETEIIEIGRISGVLPHPMPAGKTWRDYVEEVSPSEYRRGIEICKQTRADQSRGVWLYNLTNGKGAGEMLADLPRLIWAHVFGTKKSAGDTLANQIAPNVEAIKAAVTSTKKESTDG